MTASVGSKDWWMGYLKQDGKLQAVLQKQGDYEFIEVTNSANHFLQTQNTIPNPETILKRTFTEVDLFRGVSYLTEDPVRLGSGNKKIDMVVNLEDSIWPIEFKIVKTPKAKLDVRQAGQAIGQIFTLSYLLKKRYKESLSKKIMPSICTWEMGSGSSEIIDVCRMLGITSFEVHGPERATIWFLRDDSPTSLAKDWRRIVYTLVALGGPKEYGVYPSLKGKYYDFESAELEKMRYERFGIKIEIRASRE